jgi:hypothetical protein
MFTTIDTKEVQEHVDILEKPKRRIGQFYIDYELIDRWPDVVVAAMRGMIVIRCELLAGRNAFHYQAIGEMFDECPRYCEPRWYDAVCHSRLGKPDTGEPRHVIERIEFIRRDA